MTKICELCGQETPVCRCDLAWLEMKAKLRVMYQDWREKGLREQAAMNCIPEERDDKRID